jgi:tripartite-type tricarboxylate transporter receptor subunit TctC
MLIRCCVTAIALALGAMPPTPNRHSAGKQLTILVNYDAGGPTDLEARLLSAISVATSPAIRASSYRTWAARPV